MTTPQEQPITADSPIQDLPWGSVPIGFEIARTLTRAGIQTVGEIEVMTDEELFGLRPDALRLVDCAILDVVLRMAGRFGPATHTEVPHASSIGDLPWGRDFGRRGLAVCRSLLQQRPDMTVAELEHDLRGDSDLGLSLRLEQSRIVVFVLDTNFDLE